MFFVLATVVSLAVAFLRGRTPEDIVRRPFRLWQLAIVGVILHFVVNLSAFSMVLATHPGDTPLPLGALLYLASFAFLIVFLVANFTQPGFPVLLLGLLLNLVAIASNNGQMPGDPRQLAAAGLLEIQRAEMAAGLWSPFSLMGPSTHLALLGDRILVPLPFRHPVVVSLGDLIIAFGCFLFCNDPFRRSTTFSMRRPRLDIG
jgi:hypothetical protein